MCRTIAIVGLFPLCLLTKDQRPPQAEVVATSAADILNLGKSGPLPSDEIIRRELVSRLGVASTISFPTNLPWVPLKNLAVKETQLLEESIREDPFAFVQKSLRWYEQHVQGLAGILRKRERIDGKLLPLEIVKFYFRDEPHSVFMRWLNNVGEAEKALYVEGENDNRIVIRPSGRFRRWLVVTKGLNDADVKNAARFGIDQFGIRLGTKRTIATMKAAKERGELHLKYKGIARVPQLNDRLCFVIVRSPYNPPEREGINELTLYYDLQTWLQVGSVVKDVEGKLLGEYYFRDLEINPTFKAGQFTRKAI